jgi:hypothetical protein
LRCAEYVFMACCLQVAVPSEVPRRIEFEHFLE